MKVGIAQKKLLNDGDLLMTENKDYLITEDNNNIVYERS